MDIDPRGPQRIPLLPFAIVAVLVTAAGYFSGSLWGLLQ